MPYIVAIGHRINLRDLLDKFSFEDFEDASSSLEEAGLTVFLNEKSNDVFITIHEKYKLLSGDYLDCDFTLTSEELKLLSEYSGKTDQRVKLFWIESNDETGSDILDIDAENLINIMQSFLINNSN